MDYVSPFHLEVRNSDSRCHRFEERVWGRRFGVMGTRRGEGRFYANVVLHVPHVSRGNEHTI